MKQVTIFFCCLLLSIISFAQSLSWAQSLGLPNSQCGVSTIALDDSNNIYSLGGFMNTVDFNAGNGVNNLTAIGTVNTFLLKEDANGNFIWVRQLVGLSPGVLGIWGLALALDSAGNIYIAGNVKDSFDVDPGPNVHKISSPYNYDAYILKLNHNGDFLWVKQFGNNIQTVASSVGITGMRLDVNNNIYLACSITGTNDVDPGANIVSVTVAGNSDVLIEKLDSAGNFVWYKQISSNNAIEPFALEIDSLNNLYFTGQYKGTVDFDPSIANTAFVTSSGGNDLYIEKLDSSGTYVWAKQFGESLYDDASAGITIDKHNNVLVAGFFEGTVDFDPGLGVSNLYAPSRNIFILKLNNSGNYIWAKNLYNTPCNDGGSSIVTDLSNNVYVTGNTSSSVDFDPGTGTYYLNNQGSDDVFVEKLDSSGNFINAVEFGTSGYDFANTIRLDKFNNVLVSGVIGGFNSPGSGDFDPGLGVYNMIGDNFGFLEKLCVTPPAINITVLNDTICVGDTAYLSVDAIQGATYVWGKDGIPIANSNNDTLKVTQAGNYTAAVYGVGCPYGTDTVHVYVSPVHHPTISIYASTSVQIGQQATVSANLTGVNASYLIHWFVNGQMFTTSSSSFSYTKTLGIDTIHASLVVQAPCYDTAVSGYWYIHSTDGIEDINHSTQFLVFPNPAHNTLYIQSQQGGSLVLSDIMGRVMLQSSIINHQSQIDISSLVKGVYLLRFCSNDGAVETMKVVKE